jgi:DNA mismatch endonuclease (patch repair protein)
VANKGSIRARAPSAANERVRRVMLANLPNRTLLDGVVTAVLDSRAMRYDVQVSPLPNLRCTVDITFPAERVAVLVHGCFWHGCKRHFQLPRTNSDWWAEKIAATVRRDRRQAKQLRAGGWKVVTVWEHDLRGARRNAAVGRIVHAASVPVKSSGLETADRKLNGRSVGPRE